MIIRNFDYTKINFWLSCRCCGKKREFSFKKLQRRKGAVLRCLTCGLLVSRHLKVLAKQIDYAEKRDLHAKLKEEEK